MIIFPRRILSSGLRSVLFARQDCRIALSGGAKFKKNMELSTVSAPGCPGSLTPKTRRKQTRQTSVLQNRVKALADENEKLQKQFRDVMRERDRQLREVAALEAQKYESKLDQVRRRMHEQRMKEVQMVKSNIARDFSWRVDVLQQSKQKEVNRMQSRLIARENLQDTLTKARKEVQVLRQKLEEANEKIASLDKEYERVRKEYKAVKKELEETRLNSADEVRNMREAYEEQKEKLEYEIKLMESRVAELELRLHQRSPQRTPAQRRSPAASPIRGPNPAAAAAAAIAAEEAACASCSDMRVSLKLADSEKAEAELKLRKMESALSKSCEGLENNSVVKTLLTRVQQMEAEHDRLQATLREAKDQNELLEFQLLERKEEQEEIERTRGTWHHPFTVLSPVPADDYLSASEDEGTSRDEAYCSDSASEQRRSQSMTRATSRQSQIPVANLRLSDDLRIRFSLLRHRRTLRNEDRKVVADVKKRWDALETELNRYKQSLPSVSGDSADGSDGASAGKVVERKNSDAQTEETADTLFERRQELAKLKYMLRASEDTEKRQKQCVTSLKQQLESLKASREAEMDILKKTVSQYSKELSTYRHESHDEGSGAGTSESAPAVGDEVPESLVKAIQSVLEIQEKSSDA